MVPYWNIYWTLSGSSTKAIRLLWRKQPSLIEIAEIEWNWEIRFNNGFKMVTLHVPLSETTQLKQVNRNNNTHLILVVASWMVKSGWIRKKRLEISYTWCGRNTSYILNCYLHRGVHDIIVIVVRNGYGDLSSNFGLGSAFHIAQTPAKKVCIQLFSLQLWVNSRANWLFNLVKPTSLGEGKHWIQTPLKNWPCITSCSCRGIGKYICSASEWRQMTMVAPSR